MGNATTEALDPAGFRFGIEHEVAFLDRQQRFADFTCTRFDDFQRIVDTLPVYAGDTAQLRVGDAGIKRKRWYVEGFERFLDQPQPVDCVPKGVEIRTTIHHTIAGAVGELDHSLALLRRVAAAHGYTRVGVSFNPFQTAFVPRPALNGYELAQRKTCPEMQTAEITMLTYGPDLNLSHAALGPADVVDGARKLTAYSPFIVPFSFGSPFYGGGLWEGLSPRTFVRTGLRPAALGYVPDAADGRSTQPSLTRVARLPAEVGRIEFKAFDSCATPHDYAPLLALLKGMLLDTTLWARADVPDRALHRRAARHGFADAEITHRAGEVLAAVERALRDDADLDLVAGMRAQLDARRTPAHRLVERFRTTPALRDLLEELAAAP
jgi:gamma-glutamyl:cysteine ligase YbdK (ATP-grasp superfamily)